MKIVDIRPLVNIDGLRKEAIEILNNCDAFVIGYRTYKDNTYEWLSGNLKKSDMVVLGNLITAHAVHQMDEDL